MNPYLIHGPAQISFSGGRSSAMMLCKIVEAHGGTLPDDIVVLFANTGKEREETLEFVRIMAHHLNIEIIWLEYVAAEDTDGKVRKMGGPQKDRWKRVTFETASRNGEPFAEVIARAGMPPTVMLRNCTAHLKIKPMGAYMLHRFGLGIGGYTTVTGIRADEPRRVARARGNNEVNFALPLADAGVGKFDVIEFCKTLPRDLALPTLNGETIGGNCDLCYLKTTRKLISAIRDEPSRADWWIKQEASGKLFRIDRPNYAALKIIATQPQLFDLEEQEDAQPCECTD